MSIWEGYGNYNPSRDEVNCAEFDMAFGRLKSAIGFVGYCQEHLSQHAPVPEKDWDGKYELLNFNAYSTLPPELFWERQTELANEKIARSMKICKFRSLEHPDLQKKLVDQLEKLMHAYLDELSASPSKWTIDQKEISDHRYSWSWCLMCNGTKAFIGSNTKDGFISHRFGIIPYGKVLIAWCEEAL